MKIRIMGINIFDKRAGFRRQLFVISNLPLLLVGLGLIFILGGCSTSDSGSDALSSGAQFSVYSTLQDSTALKDSRLRELVPTQRDGGFAQLKIGAEDGLALDYIVMDSSVLFLDSIPRGSVILACTLWVKLGTLSDNINDSVVLDLWSVAESWNEREVSWQSRIAGGDWQVAGGGGQLVTSGFIGIKRISLSAFEWRIGGEVFDTLLLQSAIAVPIPITVSLAQEMLEGLSFGFALRRNFATTLNARFSFVTNDNLQKTNRPHIDWVF